MRTANPMIAIVWVAKTKGPRMLTLSERRALKNATIMARRYGGVVRSWALASEYPKFLIIEGKNSDKAYTGMRVLSEQ